MVRFGDSAALVTACRARPTPARALTFSRLTVDYREYTYASGRIPGGFFKREGKPAEKEVLTSRCSPDTAAVPRRMAVRDAHFRARPVGRLGERHRRPLPITGASAALALSEIPFEKTIAASASWSRRRHLRRQPDLPAAQGEQAGLLDDGLVMVEALTRTGRPGARDRARGDSGSRCRD